VKQSPISTLIFARGQGFNTNPQAGQLLLFLDSFRTFAENLTTLDKETFTSPAASQGYSMRNDWEENNKYMRNVHLDR